MGNVLGGVRNEGKAPTRWHKKDTERMVYDI
jgi:hypothetical protein